jgi:hydroxymethylbilane synthase
MNQTIRIGTRESQLAVWQAETVKSLLEKQGYNAELIYITSEGDTDLKTPLYEIGVQGIFTKTLDIALLKGNIDIAVHSMKDVPTMMAKGIVQAAVLPRASYKDLFVPRSGETLDKASLDARLKEKPSAIIATSSLRRKAQWLNRFREHNIENLRGNVNTRLRKVSESNWDGAIFAAAGLERIDLRPANAVELDWMLPAPAQGAIVVVCRENDQYALDACASFHDEQTALCTKIERDFLRGLLGGCSTPISALAEVEKGQVVFSGNILSTDGAQKKEIHKQVAIADATDLGYTAAKELLQNGGQEILDSFQK